MKYKEYETELKNLYDRAIKLDDIVLALDILERGRAIGIKDMKVDKEIGEDN